MSTTVDSDAVAKKHNLEGQDLEFFNRYITAHLAEMATNAAIRVTDNPVERKSLEQEASGYAADLWEMKHEINSKVAPALTEYFTLELNALRG